MNNKEIYKMTLYKIAALTVKIAEDFEYCDDPVSHCAENVYEILSEVGAV